VPRRPVPDPPAPGQESVWDYPRPPRIEPTGREAVVEFGGVVVARTGRALRVLETSHPPGIYFPPDDVRVDLLVSEPGHTVCEWKGAADYYSIEVEGNRARQAAWCYPRPTPGFDELAGYFSFYPGRVDRCLLGNEVVRAQAGGFYGGWITSDVVGPFKGEPGSLGW
jgi:uncharacterized protein (DUF427 family)